MYGGWIVLTVIIAGIPTLVFKRPRIIKKYFPLIAEIENGKIIEIDATVIGGILILITLTEAARGRTSELIDFGSMASLTVAIVIPFAISAIAVMMHRRTVDRGSMLLGFLTLIMAIGMIVAIVLPSLPFRLP
jgi:hypothetical protein